jgi:hypothetical protein
MHATAAFEANPANVGAIDGATELLPRHPIFTTRDLEHAREHMGAVWGDHRVAYLPNERRLDFRHREAKLGSIAVNSMQFGAGVMVNCPRLSDFYLLQFTLAGRCELHRHASRLCRDHQSAPAIYKNLVPRGPPTRHTD